MTLLWIDLPLKMNAALEGGEREGGGREGAAVQITYSSDTLISDSIHILQVFPWKYLENLYFRDKKFSIEVHDPKR